MTIGHTMVGKGSEGVIVLPGWLSDHSVFEPMYPSLDTATFTYAFLDYRGYGQSRHLAGEHTINEMAADVIALADQVGWQRFHLVGHSMGGMASQRVAVDARERVKSIVALTPVPACGVPFDEQGWALFSGAAEHDAYRRIILDTTTGNRLCGHWLNWMVQRSRETTTRAAFAEYLLAWAKTDFAAEVKGLPVPLQVLIGAHDPVVNEALMRSTYLTWYPQASLEAITNAGHYPMQETPVYLATTIQRFLGTHQG